MSQLPLLFSGNTSEFVSISYDRIQRCLERGEKLLGSEEPDVLRLKLAADNIDLHCAPLLNDFRKMACVPNEWLRELVREACGIQERLRSAMRAINEAEELTAKYKHHWPLNYSLIFCSRSGNHIIMVTGGEREQRRGRGRPTKEVDKDLISFMFGPSRNLSITKMAHNLGMHRNTLARKMKSLGVEKQYSPISNDHLQSIIRTYREENPDTGQSYVISHLRSQHLRVQRARVRDAIEAVDGVGVRLRERAPIVRRKYSNPGPMAVWHMDGHLKGILWGVSIHGIVDGYSRKVSDHNRISQFLNVHQPRS